MKSPNPSGRPAPAPPFPVANPAQPTWPDQRGPTNVARSKCGLYSAGLRSAPSQNPLQEKRSVGAGLPERIRRIMNSPG